MSSYICRRQEWEKVIKAWMINGEALRRLPTEDEFNKAWHEIVTANYDAVNNRYPNHPQTPDKEDLTPPIMMDIIMANYSKKELYDALREYMYQVCDLDDYSEREGYYKCRWCLMGMLDDYIKEEFGEE